MPHAPAQPRQLLLAALAEIAGAAIVLDEQLKIVGATPAAEALLEAPVRAGVAAVKLLCGQQTLERPLAEALAAGRPIATTIRRVAAGRERALRVRATPLVVDGVRAAGWLLFVAEAEAGDGGVVTFQGIETREPAIKRLFEIIAKVARTESRVLVRGETGSGKELVARAIHALSPRASGPFRAINCAALPGSLLESELFGHVRGAFTGAVRDNPGHFRLASGGTLFLDEVGEMPLELQSKMLRVVETGTVIPVGGRDPVPVDVRIVAATHRSLRAETAAGRFRADLMYRLRVVPIFLPPLRQRPADVSLIAERIVGELSERGPRRVERIAAEAMAALEAYPWPGNVRELHNALEYAYVIGDGPVILASDLPPEITEPPVEPEVAAPGGPPEEDVGAALLKRTLERTGGNREAAARILGISRSTLWRRMKALQLV